MDATDIPPPAPASDKYRSLLNNCQRDINRCCDQQDRNLRKRGLQKLLDDLPWTGKGGSGTKKALKQVITNDLLPPLIGVSSVSGDEDSSLSNYRPGGLLADPIEKCRELSMQLVKKILENVTSLGSNALIAIMKAMVRRINNNPFPETVEELRLILVENLQIAVTCAQTQHNKMQEKKSKEDGNECDEGDKDKEESKGESEAKESIMGVVAFEESKYRSVLEEVVQSLPYASLDNFPAVKRATATLYISIATSCPLLARLHFKKVAYGIGENALHQHSKTRVLAVRALKTALVHVTDEFEFVMGKRDGPPDAANTQDPSRTWGVGVSTLTGAATVDGTAIPTTSGSAVKSKKVNLSLLFMKLLADSNASVRKELCLLCKEVLLVRLARYTALCNSAGEIEMVVLLLLLLGDEVTEVSQTAMDSLEAACSVWTGAGFDFDEEWEVSTDKGACKVSETEGDVEDAEAEMRSLAVSDATKATGSSNDKVLRSSRFVANHIHSLSALFIKGIAEWTQTSQLTYLRGLDSMLLLAGAQGITAVLSTLLNALGGPCRDDHVAIRVAAEQCCARIGQVLPDPLECVELLMPGIAGIRSGGGGDTASQRAMAVRVLTCVFKGLPYACVDGTTGVCALLDTVSCCAVDATTTGNSTTNTTLVNTIIPIQNYVVYSESTTTRVGGHINTAVLQRGKGMWGPLLKVLSNASITEYREDFFREALLLLVRSIIACVTCQFSIKQMAGDGNTTTANDEDSEGAFIDASADKDLCKVLLCLQGQLTGEANVVPAAAYNEFMALSCMCMEAPASGVTATTTAIDQLFAQHYPTILDELLVDSYLTTQSKDVQQAITIDNVPLGEIHWTGKHPLKATFEVLLKLAPLQSWKQHAKILAVMIPQVELPAILDKDSTEAQEKSYLAVRGETDVYADAEAASTRLSLMASLEGWIRAGSNDWQCSSYIQAASASMLKNILCKNLVWRVGRVEATIRKVNLASTHSLLNAGAVQPQHLYEVAGTLVPQITSQLDDSDTSTRHMAILSLTTIFERLRGAFGPQAVQELYPKLIKCLDDSDDEVRIQSCRAIAHFMASCGTGAYSGTALDYTIEQLLIHLDDPDKAVQQVVYEALMVAAKLGEEAAVCLEKKAHQALSSHREGSWCKKILAELQDR